MQHLVRCTVNGGGMGGELQWRVAQPLRWTSFLLVVFVLTTPSRAQQPSISRPLSLSGQIGLSAEAYACSGIPDRRAPTSTQLFANTQFNILGLRSGVNLLYSTDNSRVRQSMNRLAFSGQWRWVQISLGDVSPTLTKFSVSGVTVRGGQLELTPGRFLITFAGGRSQRAVAPSTSPGFQQQGYARWLYAARLGYGARGGSHFHLIGMMAREQVGSLDEPGSLAPAENLTLTPDFGVSLFQGRFSMQGHVTATAFTGNTQTARVDIQGLPFSPAAIFTPRRGSRITFAGEVETALRLQSFGLRAGYERIEPGFQSLGVSYLISDQEVIRVAPEVQLLDRKLTLGGTFSHSRNNLLHQRLSTLRRMQWGTTLRALIGSKVSVTAGYQRMDNANRPVADSLMSLFQDQVAQTFMLTPSVMLRSGSMSHSVSLSATYQTFSIGLLSGAPAFGTSPNFDNINAALNYSLTLQSGLNVSVAGTYLRSNTGATDLDAAGVTLGSGLPLFKRKVVLNMSAGWSQNWISTSVGSSGLGSSGSTQWMLNSNTTFRVGSHDAVRLNVRALSSDLSGVSGNFQELQATLRYDHRF